MRFRICAVTAAHCSALLNERRNSLPTSCSVLSGQDQEEFSRKKKKKSDIKLLVIEYNVCSSVSYHIVFSPKGKYLVSQINIALSRSI